MVVVVVVVVVAGVVVVVVVVAVAVAVAVAIAVAVAVVVLVVVVVVVAIIIIILVNICSCCSWSVAHVRPWVLLHFRAFRLGICEGFGFQGLRIFWDHLHLSEILLFQCLQFLTVCFFGLFRL